MSKDTGSRRPTEEGERSPTPPLLRAVPTVQTERRMPFSPGEVAQALRPPKNHEAPPAFIFNASPGTASDRLRAGEALAKLAVYLLDTLHVDQIEALRTTIKLMDEEVAVDTEEFELLVGEPPPTKTSLIALRVETLLKAFARRRALLADSLSVDEVRRLLGVSTQFSPKWTTPPRSILAVLDFGQYRFPEWQFDMMAPDGLVPGLSSVLAELDTVPELQQLSWFTATQADLDERTPIEALRAGDVGDVKSAARALRNSVAGSA